MCVADYDYEPPQFDCDTQRRAAKVHVCCECRHRIERGERYAHRSVMWDGRPYTFKRCLLCVELEDAVIAAECSWLAEDLLSGAQATVESYEHFVAHPEAVGRTAGLLFRIRERRREERA